MCTMIQHERACACELKVSKFRGLRRRCRSSIAIGSERFGRSQRALQQGACRVAARRTLAELSVRLRQSLSTKEGQSGAPQEKMEASDTLNGLNNDIGHGERTSRRRRHRIAPCR